MRARILIVGGGVMGTSIAMHAARRCDALSEPVVLLERSELAAGSSGRSGAILRQFYTDRELAGMARDSLRTYASFRTHTGYSVGFRSSGVLTLAAEGGARTRALIETNVAMMREIGVDVVLMDADAVRTLVPGIVVADDAVAAHEPKAGFVDARRTVESFAALARYYGATTRCGAEVTGLLIESGRVCGVELGDEVIEAEQVVLAAGPWTHGLLAPLGVDLPLRVLRPSQVFYETLDSPLAELGEPAAPVSEECAEFDVDARPEVPSTHPVLLDLERGSYCRPEPDDGVTRAGKMDYAGSPVVADPGDLDESVDDGFAAWVREALVARMPAYADRAEVRRQTGMYTVTPDAQATIGPLAGIDGLFLVAGFSGHGFKLAPSIGVGVTQMLFAEPVSAFAPAFFSPERFGAGETEWTGRFGL